MINRGKRDRNKNRSFGIILGLIFLAFATFGYLNSGMLNYRFVIIGSFCELIAYGIPRLLSPFRFVMEKTGHYLGIGNTYILLTVIYVFLFIPVGLLFKLTGKDNLRRKWNSKANTYWMEKDPINESPMKNQF